MRHVVRPVHASVSVARTMASTAAGAKPRVILVLGSTGCGKTSLAVDLAHALNGEVVNCDVIQMYRGLDVASAKITHAEARGVPHHMFSFLEPHQMFTVRDFAHMSGTIISNVTARGRLPIIVGGTMYYMQSLIRSSTLEEDETAVAADAPVAPAPAAASGATPYERLKAVDPVMANRLHPHDVRKIARALQVYDDTGVPYSAVVAAQAARQQRSGGGGERQYDYLAVHVTVVNKAVHDARLDARVESMMDTGLLQELQRLRAQLAGRTSPDYAVSEAVFMNASPLTVAAYAAHVRTHHAATLKGSILVRDASLAAADAVSVVSTQQGSSAVWEDASTAHEHGLLAAIGYKEFESYFTALEAHAVSVSSVAAAGSAAAQQVLDARLAACVAHLKNVTHRYVRVQDRFIHNRFIKRGIRMLTLDTSEGSVSPAALEVVRVFAAGGDVSHALTPSAVAASPQRVQDAAMHDEVSATDGSAASVAAGHADFERIVTWEQHTCDVCGGRLINGAEAWGVHLRSKKHASAVRYAAMRADCAARGIILPLTRTRKRPARDVDTGSSAVSEGERALTVAEGQCEAAADETADEDDAAVNAVRKRPRAAVEGRE